MTGVGLNGGIGIKPSLDGGVGVGVGLYDGVILLVCRLYGVESGGVQGLLEIADLLTQGGGFTMPRSLDLPNFR